MEKATGVLQEKKSEHPCLLMTSLFLSASLTGFSCLTEFVQPYFACFRRAEEVVAEEKAEAVEESGEAAPAATAPEETPAAEEAPEAAEAAEPEKVDLCYSTPRVLSSAQGRRSHPY